MGNIRDSWWIRYLRKLSAPSEKSGEVGEYFSGVIHSTYQEQSVEIPILDLKKF